MALTHSSGARNAAANAVVDRIDLGSADAAGDLVFMTAADAAVATLLCSNPAFGNASGGTATANAVASDTNAAGGTVTKFKFQDRDNAEVFRGSVTGPGGGGDIEIDNPVVPSGVTVSLASFTYSASV